MGLVVGADVADNPHGTALPIPMKRLLTLLPALLAWLALCLPWQLCRCDCRTAVVGPWEHECHLDRGCEHTHHGDTHHSHATDVQTPGTDHRCSCPSCGGRHEPLVLPLTKPVTPPGFDDDPVPMLHTVAGVAALQGHPQECIARCVGPPGSLDRVFARPRSVVLLL